ncbi:hypothetical protein PO124_08565 [Bacillus licheniformis]|nr:hypothetical protein [Bacillus licheniformis]
MTNDVSTLKEGGAQYTAMCYEDGGTIDDLLVYKKRPMSICSSLTQPISTRTSIG